MIERYGMYKNLSIGLIKFVESKKFSERQHMLIGSFELSNSNKYELEKKSLALISEEDYMDGLRENTSNRWVYIPDNFNITKDLKNQWCLYGYYLWSVRNKDAASDYRNIITLKHFETIETKEKAREIGIQIMNSLKQIDHLKQEE